MNFALKRKLVPLGLALLLALAGCGGGGGGSSTGSSEEKTATTQEKTATTQGMTKAQFAEKLGDVCQAHTDRQVIAREAWQKKHGFPSAENASRAQLEKELVVVILPIVRDTIHDVGQLHPPPAERKTLEEFRKALEHGVKASEKDPSWVATYEGEPFARARSLSAKLGTPLCGQA